MKKILPLHILLLAFSPLTYSQTEVNTAPTPPEEKLPSGEEITTKINARDEGQFVSRKLSLRLTDKRGKVRTRETRSYHKYYDDEKRTVIFFTEPKNIKGTAFLTYDYKAPKKEDNQWLYLPALRKVRRISAADRGDYFLGTDMTYEDIKLETKVSTVDYDFRTTGTCINDGHPGFAVEGIPINKKTARELGYSKVLSCVDKAIWMIRNSQFWDIKGNLLKTVNISNIEQIQGIWTQQTITVENHKTKHHTTMTFSDVDYDSPVPENLFTTNAIKRGI